MIFKALSSKSKDNKSAENPLEFKGYSKFRISKGILLSDFKRYWWVSLLYSIVLIGILPLHILLQGAPLPGEPWKKEALLRALDFSVNNQLPLLLVVPVVLAALLFRYIQTTRSAGMAHALPVSRTTHFATHILSGIVLLSVPILLTGAVLLIAVRTSFLGQFFTAAAIIRWMYLYFVFAILLFSSAVFAGMFTGNSIAQIVFTYILNILPLGLHMIIQYNIGSLLHGYPKTLNIVSLYRFLPIVNLFNSSRYSQMQNMQAGELNSLFGGYTAAVYIVISVILFALALFLYRVRKLEVAGDIITFPALRPIFKYGLALCVMLLSGMYFSSATHNKLAPMLIGYLLGSLVGYIAAEILLQKSFKILGSYKGYLTFVVIAAVIYTALSFDMIGYSSRVPELSEVDSVYFGNTGYDMQTIVKAENGKVDPFTPEQYIKNFTFKNTDLVHNIINLHKAMAATKENSGIGPQYSYYALVYHLKNGSYLKREYAVNDKQLKVYLKPIYEAPEYKAALFPFIAKKSSDIANIRLSYLGDASVTLSGPSEIGEFIDVVKRQVSGYSYEKLNTGLVVCNVEISYQDSRRDVFDYYPIHRKDELIIQWLKDKGYFEKVIMTPEKVDSIILQKPFTNGRRSGSVEITDKRLIEKLMDIDYDYRFDPKTEQIQVSFQTFRSSSGYTYPRYVLTEAGFGDYLTKLDQ